MKLWSYIWTLKKQLKRCLFHGILEKEYKDVSLDRSKVIWFFVLILVVSTSFLKTWRMSPEHTTLGNFYLGLLMQNMSTNIALALFKK